MKRMCRSALALGTAGFLSVGTIAGVGLPTTVIAVAQAEETCSETDFARITEGHQDMALKSDDGQLEFVLKDDHAEKEHESGKFVVQVSDETKMTIPDTASSELPSEGWVLPQTQKGNIPWLGFSTQHLSEDYLGKNETATLSMAIAKGPENGRIVAFQNDGIEGTKIRMDTKDGTAWDFPGNTHAHPSFLFTEPGAYAVSFTFELSDGSRHNLHAGFLVGDDADVSELCDLDYDEADDAEGTVPSDPSSRPQQLAKDIKGIDKAVQELDKELENTLKEGQKFLEGGNKGDKGSKSKDGENNSGSNGSQSQGSKDNNSAGNNESGGSQKSGQSQGTQQPGSKPSGGSKPSAHKTTQSTGHGSGAGSGAASRGASSGSKSKSSGSKSKSGKSSSSGSKGGSTPKAKHSTKKKSESSKSKSPASKSAKPSSEASAKGNNENNEALADAAYTASLTKSSFWAGILAGIGAFALILGIGLLVYVQFFRKKKDADSEDSPSDKAAQQPADQQSAEAADAHAEDATTQFPRVD
ncbi:choice-of-anchor M domain-containing protein [Corynebacterium accolens]|uniref:choice-of-anchor M domain-containing protein n=1 Tax=Corynebacterium accolens TaxID=38284 RepID=UPI00254DEB9E|nr:choice-of-anchor M domain-containing protein [Corynebacterium accolens]MDK8504892.1 choice-of-anchor M domain-containing protein [Corynebacterium accolens]MDK8661655.1 choice-of-anchor M domain-containing protein [Corynebacterium accolens]